MRARRAIVPITLAIGLLTFAPLAVADPGCPLAPLVPCPTPPAPPPPPVVAPPPAEPALRIGLTELDPRLLVGGGRLTGTAGKVIALRPSYVRVLIPWERLQPRAGVRPNWDAPPTGCPPQAPRCYSGLGVRALLRAIKHRQEADGGGWRILVSPYFTPSWAAAAPVGCQKPRFRNPRGQMPRIGAYRRMLRGLQGLADKEGVQIDYIAPWNEPNHPGFLNPQRAVCYWRSKALAPALYARIARAAAAELRPYQKLVLGSLAGLQLPRKYGAGAAEFIRGLPRDVACMDGPFALHAFIGEPGRAGRRPPIVSPAKAARHGLLATVFAALDAKRCATPKVLWIGETGTFDHRCAPMAAALRTWAADDRIAAAFQYTFRESSAFPVGLVSHSMLQTYGSYRAWLAYAGEPATAPATPCAGGS